MTDNTKKVRKPHLLSVPQDLYSKMEKRARQSGQTPGELTRQLLSCWLEGLPLPVRVVAPPAPVAAPPPPPIPLPGDVTPPARVAPRVLPPPPALNDPPAAPAAPPRPPAFVPPVTTRATPPDVNFDDPNDAALREARALLDRTKESL